MMPWKENVRGTSALLYHLLVHRDEKIRVVLYSFNMNRLSNEQVKQASKELDIEIHLLPIPWWYKALFRFHLLFLRAFLPVPIGNYIRLRKQEVTAIKGAKPDGIWIYGEELSKVSRQFAEYKRVHTLPDAESLYYYRLLGNHIGLSSKFSYIRYALMYPKYVNMEQQFDCSNNIKYHVVGEADAKMLQTINSEIDVHFIRHPHYEVPPKKEISFSKDKIRILIAGQNNIYMSDGMNGLTPVLCKAANELSSKFVITFLGKGWKNHAMKLKEAGWETHIITYAQDYTAEVCSHDIQIVPITIGTGTKGKVLDALSAGLLVIGTPYAMENIAVKDRESCIAYNSNIEVVKALEEITKQPARYEAIATNGRKAILEYHSRKTVSREMFNLFGNSCKTISLNV